ncbi:internalin [Marivirga lumbricoides]|uniref:Internalin n=1 Tax=Marivirga lumbricoides TaxID=1046115 RepID=A0A2T4DUM3_9BACT|nr:internalin [Marivirga lumbricoides]
MISNKFFTTGFFIIVLSCFSFIGHAQQLGDYTKSQVQNYQSKAEDQVRFLAYLLNTLGNENSSPRDKDVIIRESYKKIFKDSKVQVEDDLTSDRKVLVNKDITAYLKDIDFFYKNVKFDFDVQEVEPFLRPDGGLSFKVTLNRTLKGTDLEGEPVLNTKKRYIEINLDEATDGLQIASIYTTKVSREEALKEWWKNLSLGWKSVFREKLAISSDSVDINTLYKIAGIDSLNLAGNNFIVTLDPISMLVDLKKIDLSNTKIQDISSLSSLTEIQELNLSNTAIEEISYLRYAEKLRFLNLSFTQVKSLDDLLNLKRLERLYLRGTDITDFSMLSNFTDLKEVDLSETYFNKLDVLVHLSKLQTLNLGRSNVKELNVVISPQTLENLDLTFAPVADISALKGNKALKTLNISNTQVMSLEPLSELKNLEKIYADNTFISQQKATDFTDANPQVLVIINSEELSAWWASLSPQWKSAFSKYIKETSGKIPAKEQLTKLLLVDSLKLNNTGLTELFPLKKFSRLRYLSISDNDIISLEPLRTLNSLIELNAENIDIAGIDPLLSLKKLSKLNLSRNQLSNELLMKLTRLKSLTLLNVDGTQADKDFVREFLGQIDNNCIVIYDSEGLKSWWNGLSSEWQQIMQLQLTVSNPPTVQELHELTAIKNIVIIDEGIENLTPFEQFVQLESLHLERVALTDVSNIERVGELKRLTIKETPIEDVEPIARLKNLEELVLNYSAVDDLRALEDLKYLERLSVAGTKIRNLKGVENLYSLRYLDVSSSMVRKLKRLSELDNLEQVRCYNTRISERRVEGFKEENPDCVVRYY